MGQLANPVFKSIADPTRRKIIDLLSESEKSVKELTQSFDISQPAISQHLRELRLCHLVQSHKVGLEQRYRLTAEPLKEVFSWVSRYRTLFDPAGHGWTFVQASKEKPLPAAKKGVRL